MEGGRNGLHVALGWTPGLLLGEHPCREEEEGKVGEEKDSSVHWGREIERGREGGREE